MQTNKLSKIKDTIINSLTVAFWIAFILMLVIWIILKITQPDKAIKENNFRGLTERAVATVISIDSDYDCRYKLDIEYKVDGKLVKSTIKTNQKIEDRLIEIAYDPNYTEHAVLVKKNALLDFFYNGYLFITVIVFLSGAVILSYFSTFTSNGLKRKQHRSDMWRYAMYDFYDDFYDAIDDQDDNDE